MQSCRFGFSNCISLQHDHRIKRAGEPACSSDACESPADHDGGRRSPMSKRLRQRLRCHLNRNHPGITGNRSSERGCSLLAGVRKPHDLKPFGPPLVPPISVSSLSFCTVPLRLMKDHGKHQTGQWRVHHARCQARATDMQGGHGHGSQEFWLLAPV